MLGIVIHIYSQITVISVLPFNHHWGCLFQAISALLVKPHCACCLNFCSWHQTGYIALPAFSVQSKWILGYSWSCVFRLHFRATTVHLFTVFSFLFEGHVYEAHHGLDPDSLRPIFYCVVSAFSWLRLALQLALCDKWSDQVVKRKGLSQLMISEASAHGCLTVSVSYRTQDVTVRVWWSKLF